MSNDTVYSKQILDTLKDGCEKVTTIFNNVTTLRKTPSKGGEKVSSRNKQKKNS